MPRAENMHLTKDLGGIPPHQNKETKQSKGMEPQDLGPWKKLVSTQLEKLIDGAILRLNIACEMDTLQA